MLLQSRLFFACIAIIGVALFVVSLAAAQAPLPVPEVSPAATVSQKIGVSDVAVSYHRPGVKGRVIWGTLVKYSVAWRAGANENTTISFSDPVKVEGKDLPAGTYGLHMIPSEGTWTIIFSKNHTSWGSYSYKESEDALRVTVKPEPAEPAEWLAFEFSDLSNTAATLSLHWEKLRVPIKLEFDTDAIVLANARNAYLRSNAGFSWFGYNSAAAYCLRRGVDLEEGLAWADRSIGYNENFTNTMTKAGLLEKLGRAEEANKLREHAEGLAQTEQELNNLGYQYLGANKVKEALELFKKNVKNHPNSMNAYDSLGEGYAKAGDTKRAIESYTKAISLTQDEDNKSRINDEMQKLQKK